MERDYINWTYEDLIDEADTHVGHMEKAINSRQYEERSRQLAYVAFEITERVREESSIHPSDFYKNIRP